MARKTQKDIELTGRFYNSDRELVVAKTQDADEVVCFIGASPDGTVPEYFHVQESSLGGIYVLTTRKGEYILGKHAVHNYWHTIVNGIKVHFKPKKIVATLTFWA